MFDSKHKERRWNVTFYDYSSNVMDTEALNNYGIEADHNDKFIISSKTVHKILFLISSLSRFKNVFLAIFEWKNTVYSVIYSALVFADFLNEKKKLVRGSNAHLSFNCPLPTRQTD